MIGVQDLLLVNFLLPFLLRRNDDSCFILEVVDALLSIVNRALAFQLMEPLYLLHDLELNRMGLHLLLLDCLEVDLVMRIN